MRNSPELQQELQSLRSTLDSVMAECDLLRGLALEHVQLCKQLDLVCARHGLAEVYSVLCRLRTGPHTARAEVRLEFVLANGLPMCRDGQYRYHGLGKPEWHPDALAAIDAAIEFHRSLDEST